MENRQASAAILMNEGECRTADFVPISQPTGKSLGKMSFASTHRADKSDQNRIINRFADLLAPFLHLCHVGNNPQSMTLLLAMHEVDHNKKKHADKGNIFFKKNLSAHAFSDEVRAPPVRA